MTATPLTASWESRLASLLARLSAAQADLLSLLAAKRDFIVQRDAEGLATLFSREDELGVELSLCQEERQQLLSEAEAEGLPGRSLADLSAALPKSASSAKLSETVAEARGRARLIRHECLAQWVAIQRTVLHLSQMLEIIATGGQSQPTYGRGRGADRGGALIDQAV